MIKNVHIKNYRSFVDAEAPLSPFTLVIGANGAGKSNFARVFAESRYGVANSGTKNSFVFPKHLNFLDSPQSIRFKLTQGETAGIKDATSYSLDKIGSVKLYKIDPSSVGKPEQLQEGEVEANGSKVVSVLDGLKNGDREDLFEEIESHLKRYIPSIEKLSSKITKVGQKQLQVREKTIKSPFPVADLSEGTRLLLTILTIVFQEESPDIIILEDIDYGLHPRLFIDLVSTLRDIVEDKGIQIIATTHNPYMVDQFYEDEEAVLIIEKNDGESTITTLASRLEEGDTVDGALGALWYGGFVGGIPAVK